MKTCLATFIEAGKEPQTVTIKYGTDFALGIALLDARKKHPQAKKILIEFL